MNCEQLRRLLDAYMDGELSDAQLREMEAHAAACEDCRREFEAAKLVRDALGSLPEEVDVPLEAQASWRRAVREEAGRDAWPDERTAAYVRAKRNSSHRWMRAVYAVAAALVLVLGATAMLGRMPARKAVEPLMVAASEDAASESGAAAASPTQAVVARDGDVEASTLLQDESYAARKAYGAEDFAAACATVEELTEEYGGKFTTDQTGGGWAVYRVELPREYLEDFLSAVSHVGEEQNSESADVAGDTAVVYIEINELKSE